MEKAKLSWLYAHLFKKRTQNVLYLRGKSHKTNVMLKLWNNSFLSKEMHGLNFHLFFSLSSFL